MQFILFGYPKTGKTTLFNLLTGAKLEIKTYAGVKEEPHLRTCPVPDHRLDKLHSLYPEKTKKPASMDYIDLAGASYGEIKETIFLNVLRKTEGLAHVVRGFMDAHIPHPKGRVSPEADIRSMESELILADLMLIENRLEKLEKELQRSKTPEGIQEKELLEKLRCHLEQDRAVREIDLNEAEDKLLRSFAFLSQKPLLHIINVDEDNIDLIETPEKIAAANRKNTSIMAFCGKIELEIAELEEEEKTIFMQEYGLRELSVSRFLKSSYALMNVITYFTIGKEEIKSWTIRKGSTALEAAGQIHTDMAAGFIRAEVISWDILMEKGGFQPARDSGDVRLEGKEYPVQDGDAVYFRFSK
jgi:ribosome-binding ATPase